MKLQGKALLFLVALVLACTALVHGYIPHFSLPAWKYSRSLSSPKPRTVVTLPDLVRCSATLTETSSEASTQPAPGRPVITKLDNDAHVASMRVSVPGTATQTAFDRACSIFNEEVRQKNYKMAGFRPGAKLPPQYLFEIYGEREVKNFCGTLLSEAIMKECDQSGLRLVGRGRIMDFRPDAFMPGLPHTIDIECDLWPEITYAGGERGYVGLNVTVVKDARDNDKIDKVKQSIRERYQVLSSTPVGYAAQLGDVAVVNMKGYERGSAGSAGGAEGSAGFGKAKPLPAVANGDQVEVLLEHGKFMPGLVEALVGCAIGDARTVDVTFPQRTAGPGAALAGKNATFEVQVLDVKTRSLPAWDDNLANTVREGMTLQTLDAEVRAAIEGDASSSTENARNEALSSALLNATSVSKLPESLLEETTKARYESMVSDFKDQGATTEQLEAMLTPEKYARYKELSRASVEKVVKLGLLFRDIIEREKERNRERAADRDGAAGEHGDNGADTAVTGTAHTVVAAPEVGDVEPVVSAGTSTAATRLMQTEAVLEDVTDAEISEQWEALVAQAKQKKEAPPDKAAAREEIAGVLTRKKVFAFLASHASISYVDAPVGDA